MREVFRGLSLSAERPDHFDVIGLTANLVPHTTR